MVSSGRSVKHLQPTFMKLSVHGASVQLGGQVDVLPDYGHRLLAPFEVPELPEELVPLTGLVLPYDAKEVVRHLSSSAQRVPQLDPWLELYQDGERFWLVDERWGICEVNFLRGQWRSWLLQQPTADPVRQVEGALLWPMAQLLRPRGLHLIPAIAVARDGWGLLILSAFSLEPELRLLLEHGYRLIGQRWTAMREDAGKIELLHMPGAIECQWPPRLRRSLGRCPAEWVDLEQEFPAAAAEYAFCDTVVLVEPGRRSTAHAHELSEAEAQRTLRSDWPIVDLHPTRRSSLPMRLGERCRCACVQLSRRPDDLLVLLNSLRSGGSLHRAEVAVPAPRKQQVPLGGAWPQRLPA